jgi:hypothetical protein
MNERIRHYADILNPLFWRDEFKRMDRLFEFACTLIRASGLQDTGWDSYYESLALLEDLKQLQLIELDPNNFPFPEVTRARLALISYCHVTEMNFPYELLANLIRLHLGKKYCMNPLAHLMRPITRKVNGIQVIRGIKMPSPDKNIKEIELLSAQAGIPEVGVALREIYDPVIRNAVYHSDFVLHDKSMRLLSDLRLSKKGDRTSIIPFDELGEVINDAFAFHSALIQLYKRSCHSFTDFRHSFLPYDPYYKGILEFTFENPL